MKLEDINKRLVKIEKRNEKVELDKSWEGSITRRVILITFTYLSVGLYMSAINVNRPWINAVVPSFGFLLSTLTLPLFKNIWIKNNKKQK